MTKYLIPVFRGHDRPMELIPAHVRAARELEDSLANATADAAAPNGLPMYVQAEQFIRQNPGRTARQIAAAMNLSIGAVGVITTRLRDKGRVRRMANSDDRRVRWEIGSELESLHSPQEGKFSQRTVSAASCAPHHVRDPFVAFIHGPAGENK